MHLIVVEHEAAASVGRLAPHLVEHRVTTVRPATGTAEFNDPDAVILRYRFYRAALAP